MNIDGVGLLLALLSSWLQNIEKSPDLDDVSLNVLLIYTYSICTFMFRFVGPAPLSSS